MERILNQCFRGQMTVAKWINDCMDKLKLKRVP